MWLRLDAEQEAGRKPRVRALVQRQHSTKKVPTSPALSSMRPVIYAEHDPRGRRSSYLDLGLGTVFKLRPNMTQAGRKAYLHSFHGGDDGASPRRQPHHSMWAAVSMARPGMAVLHKEHGTVFG